MRQGSRTSLEVEGVVGERVWGVRTSLGHYRLAKLGGGAGHVKKRTRELSIQVFGGGKSLGRRHGRRGILSFSRQVR